MELTLIPPPPVDIPETWGMICPIGMPGIDILPWLKPLEDYLEFRSLLSFPLVAKLVMWEGCFKSLSFLLTPSSMSLLFRFACLQFSSPEYCEDGIVGDPRDPLFFLKSLCLYIVEWPNPLEAVLYALLKELHLAFWGLSTMDAFLWFN